MTKRVKSETRVFTTEDIKKLGISRELNAKYEREKFLPPASIEPSGGPWRAALYSEGDLIARVLMKRLTGRGLSLKTASYILCIGQFIGEAFDSGELEDFELMAFPIPADAKDYDLQKRGEKPNPDSQPFNLWAELDSLYELANHEAFIVLHIGRIREEVRRLG